MHQAGIVRNEHLHLRTPPLQPAEAPRSFTAYDLFVSALFRIH
jgi:hypothetical protein